MKKLIIALIVVVTVLIVLVGKLYISKSQGEKAVRSFANSNTIVYTVGTPRSNLLYHRESCSELQTRYKVYYLDLATAFNMGLNPCPECNPPRPSLSKREMKETIKMRDEARIQEDKEREKAARDYLNGKQNPNSKFIMSIDTNSPKAGEYLKKIKEYVNK